MILHKSIPDNYSKRLTRAFRLRRAISIQAEQKGVFEKHAIAPSASDGLLDAVWEINLMLTTMLRQPAFEPRVRQDMLPRTSSQMK